MSSRRPGAAYGNQTVGCGYDPAGNLTSVTYPNTKQISRTYNAANELTAVTDWLNNTTSFAYDANGNLLTQGYPNSTREAFAYDAANQLNNIVDSKSGTTFASFAYTRDNDGFLTSTTPTGVGQANETYSYTALKQLASVNSGTYGYDGAGNITKLIFRRQPGLRRRRPAQELHLRVRHDQLHLR